MYIENIYIELQNWWTLSWLHTYLSRIMCCILYMLANFLCCIGILAHFHTTSLCVSVLSLLHKYLGSFPCCKLYASATFYTVLYILEVSLFAIHFGMPNLWSISTHFLATCSVLTCQQDTVCMCLLRHN
jgi:hypothetical protein